MLEFSLFMLNVFLGVGVVVVVVVVLVLVGVVGVVVFCLL